MDVPSEIQILMPNSFRGRRALNWYYRGYVFGIYIIILIWQLQTFVVACNTVFNNVT